MLQLEQLDEPLVLEFLKYLETKRGNSARTRNARLTAVKSFMHFLEYRVPSALEQIRQVLSIPLKKTDVRLLDHLHVEECQAILDTPDPAKRLGIRDRAMIHLAFTAGLRVSELVGLRLDELHRLSLSAGRLKVSAQRHTLGLSSTQQPNSFGSPPTGERAPARCPNCRGGIVEKTLVDRL